MYIAMISEHASPLAVLGGTDSGGQNVYVAQLAFHLVSMGHKVDVFTRREKPQTAPVIVLKKGLRVIQVPAGPAAVVPKEELLPFMDDFTAYILDFCRRIPAPYDLAHANFWMSGLVALRLKKSIGLPFVITFHALGKIRQLHQKESDGFPECRSSMEQQIMKEADRVIAECPQDMTDMLEHYDVNPLSLSMIPCGFDPGEFFPIARSTARVHLGLSEGENILLQLGRMVPRKGIETAIRGFAAFWRASKRPSRLLIVGGNSRRPDPARTPEIGRLQEIARQEGVGPNVCFTGQVSRHLLRYYYSAADSFITVPWYEPFGITPLEAMACGVPVIGSEVGGIKYTVRHNVTGFLVPPQNHNALAYYLNEMCLDQPRRQAMGRQALHWVRQFTWDRIANRVDHLYQQVCSNVCAGDLFR